MTYIKVSAGFSQSYYPKHRLVKILIFLWQRTMIIIQRTSISDSWLEIFSKWKDTKVTHLPSTCSVLFSSPPPTSRQRALHPAWDMGRKKIQISRILDQRNRQVSSLGGTVAGGKAFLAEETQPGQRLGHLGELQGNKETWCSVRSLRCSIYSFWWWFTHWFSVMTGAPVTGAQHTSNSKCWARDRYRTGEAQRASVGSAWRPRKTSLRRGHLGQVLKHQ